MEENKVKKTEEKTITVEQANAQMQGVLKQANARIQQLAIQVQQLNDMMRDQTISHLFKVIEYAHMFDTEFTEKCVEAVKKYLTQVALTEPEETTESQESQETTEE